MSKNFSNSIPINNYDNNQIINKHFIFKEEINYLNIDLIFCIDYLSHKKKLIKFITNDIELITNLFDEEISDILINIFILKKKNKISDSEYKIIEPIFSLVYLLDEILYIDQEDLLNILLNFYKTNILIGKISMFFEKNIFGDLISFNLFKNKFDELVDKISKTNLLIFIFEKFFNIDNSNFNQTYITNELKYLAKYLAVDFFMYYDSENIYNKIMNNLLQLNETFKDDINKVNGKNDKKIHKKYNILINIFKNNKYVFTKEYDVYRKKILEIYLINEFDLKIKFKIKKNEKIIKLVKNLNFIKEL